MKDLYAILGISRNASQDDVKKAYRQMAKTYHPDLNPGNADAERKFKEISQAYDILADAEKRKRYDAGEIDADGQEQAPRAGAGAGGGFYRNYASAGRGNKYRSFDFGDEFSAEDIFADLFGGGGGAADSGFKPGFGGGSAGAGARGRAGAGPGAGALRGEDVNYSVPVGFTEAANGARKRVRLATGETVDVNIPVGSEDGDTLRLKGKGKPGISGGAPGDAYIKLNIQPHPFFERKGKDIHLDLPITLHEALEGGVVNVPTLKGSVSMRIPAHASSGKVLRLRGRGIQPAKDDTPGDQYVRLKLVLPEKVDSDLREAIRRGAERNPENPREKAGMA